MPAGGLIQPGLGNAESAASKTRFRDLVARSGLLDLLVPIRGREATEEEVLRFHTAEYLRHLKRISDAGGGDVGEMVRIGPGSYEIALRAAGGALACVEAVLDGDVDNAYALVRPPGHHAETARALGYCLFANTALAAMHARAARGVERVAIVDWDVHHGNGTEDAFYADPSVLTISLHGEDQFPPGRGLVEHRGEGRGEGYNINVPLPDGSGHGAYMLAMEHVVAPAVRRFAPDLILVACGFDASAYDPMGRQNLHSDSYRQMTEVLLEVAAECCEGRLVCIHEGGYSEGYVPFCGTAVVETLLGQSLVEDPFLQYLADRPNQKLREHQAAAVEQAAALVDGVAPHKPAAS
ncbi:MAG TPA: class II histone deacetylase [Conexibacter sp.]|jgi:acetoin utilization deacetylase AcuC-like enzyme|nr:class II histone deacetylase [Conexibacter sp.]